jgi:hypothetical protein
MSRYSFQQAHLIAHFLETRRFSREEGGAVPIPANVLRKALPSLYKDGGMLQLVEDGIFDRDSFSKEDHKCYYYTAGATLVAWLEQDRQEKYLASLLNQPMVRLMDGKLAPGLKHLLRDAQGVLLPALNRRALKTIRTNIIDFDAIDQCLDAWERQTWEGAHRLTYRDKAQRDLRCATIRQNLRAILRQKHWVRKWQFLEYVVAYKGSKTGRLFERGGGMQSMPKALKKLAYGNWDAWEVYLPQNYDIRSCHLAIIAQLCREEGQPLPMLEAYVAEKDAKYDYAARAQMDVQVWKAALVSLFYGAVLGKTKKASLYRKISHSIAFSGNALRPS